MPQVVSAALLLLLGLLLNNQSNNNRAAANPMVVDNKVAELSNRLGKGMLVSRTLEELQC